MESSGRNLYRRRDGQWVLQFRVSPGKWRETRIPREHQTEIDAKRYGIAWLNEYRKNIGECSCVKNSTGGNAMKNCELVERGRVESGEEYDEIVTVTPQLAAEWLAAHGNPNNPNRRREHEYAEMYLAGRWLCTKEGAICFCKEDGMLMNGHNRLRGVILANIPVRFVVRRNVPREVLSILDTAPTRTRKQIGKLMGFDVSNDGAFRVIESARLRTFARVPALRLDLLAKHFFDTTERLNSVLPAKFGETCKVRNGCRAGFIVLTKNHGDRALEFCASLLPVWRRETVEPRAAANLVNWIQNADVHKGELEMGAVIHAFHQYIGGSMNKAVRSDGHNLEGSVVRRELLLACQGLSS